MACTDLSVLAVYDNISQTPYVSPKITGYSSIDIANFARAVCVFVMSIAEVYPPWREKHIRTCCLRHDISNPDVPLEITGYASIDWHMCFRFISATLVFD